MSANRLAGPALAALAVAAATLTPERTLRRAPTLCPVRRLTGKPCPSCGLTRSWNAAARLKVRESVELHPLGLPALLGAMWLVAQRARGRDQGLIESPAALSIFSAVWLVVWFRRLAASGSN